MSSKSIFKETAGRAIMDKLTADEIKTENVCLTIESAFVQRFGNRGQEAQIVMVFKEFPKQGLRLNKTQANRLQALVGAGLLPDEFNEVTEQFEGWGGLPFPLVKQDTEYPDADGVVQTYKKLYPVAVSGYDKAVKSFPRIGNEKQRPAARARSTAAKKPAARGGK